jgi:hypothetical protein
MWIKIAAGGQFVVQPMGYLRRGRHPEPLHLPSGPNQGFQGNNYAVSSVPAKDFAPGTLFMSKQPTAIPAARWRERLTINFLIDKRS